MADLTITVKDADIADVRAAVAARSAFANSNVGIQNYLFDHLVTLTNDYLADAAAQGVSKKTLK